MSSQPKGALTRFPAGSVRESWHLAFPIMLAGASWGIMLFSDRLILAQYATSAMTAAASAGMVVAAFHYSLISLVSIAEVFVGQFNGSNEHKKAGRAAWQMIWVCIFCSAIFLPLAFLTGEFFVADPYDGYGVPYFKWLMIFGSIFGIEATLSAFFVGIGKPRIVTIVAILGNFINIALDFILIFGVEGLIPSMGTTGAAIASGTAGTIQVLILFYLFLSSENRKKYHTHNFNLQPRLLKKEIRVGSPTAISHLVEIGAWAMQLNLMAKAGELHITVVAIAQSVFMLFTFVSEGLNKSASAISSNYMGAGQLQYIPKSLFSSFKILMVFLGITSTVLIIYPSPILDLFIEGDYTPEFLAQLEYYSRWALFWVWVYMFADGMVWIFSGILTAAGDTKFIMYANCINAWFVGILPLYVWVILYDGTPASAWFLIALYGGFNCLCFYWRYRMGAWRENRIQD